MIIEGILNKIYIIILLFFIDGCTPYYNSSEINYFNSKILNENTGELFSLNNKNVSFTGTINSNNKTYRIKGNIKIRDKNSYQIQVISKTLGIEIIKINFNKDSVFYIDKVNKKYFHGKINEFNSIGGASFSSEQILKILFGRIPYSLDKYKCNNINNLCEFKEDQVYGEIIFNSSGFLFSQNINTNNGYLNFKYDKYLKKGNIPEFIDCKINSASQVYKLNIKIINYNTLHADLKRFSVSNSYQNIL